MKAIVEKQSNSTTPETVALKEKIKMLPQVNQGIVPQFNETTIISRDIALLTNKDHRNVCRDIKSQLGEIPSLKFEQSYIADNGRKYKEYILPKCIALGIVSGYSFELRMKIINRLEELEKELKPQTIQLPTNPMEILSLTYEALKNTNEELAEVKQDVEGLKNDIVITPSQKRILGKTMKAKVMSFEPPADKTGMLFKKGWSKLHDNFAVSSYMEIPRLKFDEAMSIINNLTLMDLVA